MKREIYKVLYSTDDVPYLTYDGNVYGEDKLISTGAADATLEELVGLCDQDAENRNAHEFCGAHRLLGAVLFRQYGRDAATVTMRDIALLGGLQGMTGTCSKGDAFEELNVGQAGHDWSGTYTN